MNPLFLTVNPEIKDLMHEIVAVIQDPTRDVSKAENGRVEKEKEPEFLMIFFLSH